MAICFEFATLHGGERSILAVLGEGIPYGWEVVLLGPTDGPLPDAAAAAGLDYRPWSVREDGHKPPPEWAVRSLRAAVDAVDADLVHANSLALARLTGRLAREDHRVCTGHLRDILRLSSAARRDLACNRTLIAVSPAVAAFHHDEFANDQRVDAVSPHTSTATIETIPNGIGPIERSKPKGFLRQELRLPEAMPLFATVGQISLRKGHDLAAAALRRVAVDGGDFRWLIVGERFSQKAESIDFERRLGEGLPDRVIRVGWRNDVPDILAETTALLHPARQEPLGRVLLEAIEVGCPVIALDVGGNRFILPNSTLVPPPGTGPKTPERDNRTIAAFAEEIAKHLTQSPRKIVESPGRFPIATSHKRTWNVWTDAVGDAR